MISKLIHALHAAQSIPGSFSLQADIHERQLMLIGRQLSWMLEQKDRLNDLSDAEFRVFSQWGEDGIVEWLVQNIPDLATTFVEFGVENYMEANTRYLMPHRNWRGLIMDGNPAYMEYVHSTSLYWKYDLKAVTAFITRENINVLLTENGFAGEIGLLSIDIDGNDYWILDAIDMAVKPSILIVEYNPILGDKVPITVPYDPEFNRFNAHYSGLYFGASIGAVRHAAEKKGYSFVGTCSNGINAFFVRDELFTGIKSKLKIIKAHPSRHRDSRDKKGKLSYASGPDRLDLIKGMPVINVEDGSKTIIGDLGSLYSEEWIQCM